jgi:phosphoribosylformylglycinamidine synthase
MTDGPIGCRGIQQRIRSAGHLVAISARYEQRDTGNAVAGRSRGYHKPIMLAGGLGNVRRDARREARSARRARNSWCSAVHAMLIGLGGGAASSVGSWCF